MRSSELTCKWAYPHSAAACQSLARASPVSEDDNYHSYYCRANYQPSWTQGGEVGQLPYLLREVLSNAFKSRYCSWECLPAKAETGPHSAVHSLILPGLLGLHHIPSTPQSLQCIQVILKILWPLLWRTRVSHIPQLQETLMTIISLPESIGRIARSISVYYGKQCIIFYNHYYLSDQLKLLTVVIWTTLYIKR